MDVSPPGFACLIRVHEEKVPKFWRHEGQVIHMMHSTTNLMQDMKPTTVQGCIHPTLPNGLGCGAVVVGFVRAPRVTLRAFNCILGHFAALVLGHCDICSKLLTELVSYMYPTYVHNMHILDVLYFLFGSRHRPY